MVQALPLAALNGEHWATRVRGGRDGARLATAMTDFLLDPTDRLTEQERALMGSMLAVLISGIAQELAVRLPSGVTHPIETDLLVERLRQSGLLASDGLLKLMLRRASLMRMQEGALGGSGYLRQLAGDPDPAVASVAMAVVIARSSSRDPFGRPGLSLNDCDAEAAVHLTYAVAAAITEASDEQLVAAAVGLLARHDEGERLEAIECRLVIALEQAGRLSSETLLTLAARGEAWMLAEALARIARVPVDAAWEMLTARSPADLGRLIRLAEQPRDVAAGLIVALAGPLSLADPADSIAAFDSMTAGEAASTRSELRLPQTFRAARAALAGHGQHHL